MRQNFLSKLAAVLVAVFFWAGNLASDGLAQAVAEAEAESSVETKEAEEEESTEQDSEDLERITYDIKYLSSDEMGGRQPGTPGIQLAEDYIVAEYKKAGLKPLDDGSYLQTFSVGNKRILLKDATELTLIGPNDTELNLALEKDYQQLISRNDFDLDTELVFVGYGITADDLNYDDYFGDLDVDGKIVVLIRREPQVDDEDSVFDGKRTTRFASGRAKVSAARRAGAAGILMVNDGLSSPDEERDELIASDRFRTNALPFAQIKRSILDEMLDASPIPNSG